MKSLTRKQKEVLDAIDRLARAKGYPPSMREITAELKLASAAGIHKHIKALVNKGALSKENYLSRSVKVVRPPPSPAAAAEMVELPMAGYVAAGTPIEAVEQRQETLPVPQALLGRRGSRHYVLRVRGDSMVDESILDEDYVIVEERDSAENGEVVIALLDGKEATLKRFYRENGGVRLQPANPNMAPIFVREGDFRIQGVVVGIWRKF